MSRMKDKAKSKMIAKTGKGQSYGSGPMNAHKAYAMGTGALEAQNASVTPGTPKSYFGNPPKRG